MRAWSLTPWVRRLMFGPLKPGRCFGRGHLAFEDCVVSLTAPGAPRMPNGVECGLEAREGEPCWLGEGRLEVAGRTVLPGPLWDPRPQVRVKLLVERRFKPCVELLAGRGRGLTPSGDDLLCGYASGLVLWHGRTEQAARIAEAAAARTSLLSATLLRCAARGELPEPAHALLALGDPAPLRRFGHTSGSALLVGLALAC